MPRMQCKGRVRESLSVAAPPLSRFPASSLHVRRSPAHPCFRERRRQHRRLFSGFSTTPGHFIARLIATSIGVSLY